MNQSIVLLTICLVGTMLTQKAEAVEVVCDHKTLSTKTSAELRLIRNTVFAKHGRKFKSTDLKSHFSQQSWYTPNAKYSDSILSEEDKRCVESVKLWEKGKPKQTLEVDLDGDGTQENVYLFDFRPKSKDADGDVCDTCFFTIGMADHNVQVKAHWTRDSWTKDTEKIERLDLFSDLRDSYTGLPQHVYLQQKQAWEEDPPYEITVLSLYKRAVHQTVLNGESYNGGRVESSGVGFLKFVKDDYCALHITEWYSWKAGLLILSRVDESFHPERSMLRKPNSDIADHYGACAG